MNVTYIRNLYRNLLQPPVSSWIHVVRRLPLAHSLDGCAIARLSDMSSTGTVIDIRAGSNIYGTMYTTRHFPCHLLV